MPDHLGMTVFPDKSLSYHRYVLLAQLRVEV